MQTTDGRGREFLLLGLLALLWGSSYPLIKVSLETIPPLTLMAFRVTAGAVLLALVAAVLGYWRGLEPLPWRRLMLQSWLNSILPWSLLAWGQQTVPSALAGILNSTSPIFVCLLTWLVFRHEKLGAGRGLGAIIGLIGVVLVIGMSALGGIGDDVIAQGAILLGAVCYGGAAIYGSRFKTLPPIITATLTLGIASAFLIPAAFLFEDPLSASPSVSSMAAALGIAVGSTAIAMMLYFRLARTLGPLGVASQAYLRAGVSVLLGVAFLGEMVTPQVALGLASLTIGVWLINRRQT